MKTERIHRKGPKQLAEIAKRLTPEEFAELRANPQESSELMKSFQKLAVKRVMEVNQQHTAQQGECIKQEHGKG